MHGDNELGLVECTMLFLVRKSPDSSENLIRKASSLED